MRATIEDLQDLNDRLAQHFRDLLESGKPVKAAMLHTIVMWLKQNGIVIPPRPRGRPLTQQDAAHLLADFLPPDEHEGVKQ